MTKEEIKLNWLALAESGSMTAIHNLRQYYAELEQENAELKEHHKKDEWHDLQKDSNDLPKHEKDVQVLYQDCNKKNAYNCVYDIHAENWLYYNLDNMVLELFPFNVIAWKEIVLPELKESE
jgi:hypothetical protein